MRQNRKFAVSQQYQ